MRYVKPHYYDDFQCIADKCPDTCCAGWQIVIDDDTLDRYEEYIQEAVNASVAEDNTGKTSDAPIDDTGKKDADFALRLANSIDWEEGCFRQNGRRCAMLGDNNLCDLITVKGEGYLCDTCNRYPRHIEEFDGVREYSLSLSCPVAAEMMLRTKEQTEYIVEEDDLPDPLEEEFEEFDFMLFTQLEDAREVILQIINDRQLPMVNRMALLMEMARQMQDCIDEDRLFEMQDVVEAFAADAKRIAGHDTNCGAEDATAKTTEITETAEVAPVLTGVDRFQMLKDGFEIYTKLERLREEWTEVLDGAWNNLYKKGYKEYEVLNGEFEEKNQIDWEVFSEQILTFFIYTYFCGAVYDDCIYSKVAMSVMSVCYIREFCMYTWVKQEKKLDLEDAIKVAYQYAREIEHSDLNLNDLEEWLMNRM